MYYRDEVIRYLQSNNILALKLDHAMSGVGSAVSNKIHLIGAGAKRALFYTSCFTEEYQDVCQRQMTEDIRFNKAVFYLILHGDVIYAMLEIYFEIIFRDKTSDQLERIKKRLMAVNVHIAANSLTKAGFAFAVASIVAVGTKLSFNVSALTGYRMAGLLEGVGMYGVVQKAAESANKLHYTHPAYYASLYSQNLEMMYFLIEPLFERANAYWQSASDEEIANLIIRMIR
ncbi:hypothetical protein [Erwinia sp. QL-Z3]|jgi:hypothetical protein|uniref:hypothetical protein n=1 Tax=Erwinia sp. QL-Z3 TaxID=2547962 RepID=UPI001070B1E6|nr:hypothetical protein [Erwinia sp. QL-Z3]QBR51807.1 hypothetical protein E2F51_18350 [Erwinia sp. QL-Z3]